MPGTGWRPGIPTLLICAVVFILAGCRTAPPMQPVNLAEPGWTIHRGQALWQPKAGSPELAGRILVASNGSGEDFIRFSKDPLEIVLARRHNDRWVLEMPGFNKSYSGHGQPPERIAWFQLVHAVFRNTVAPGWQWSRADDRSWRLTNSQTGERLEGFFTQ